MQVESFLDRLTEWAQSRSDVLGLAIVGSHARGTASPDSDIDVIILCRDTAALTAHYDWAARFGKVREVVTEQYGMVRALRVFYEDGLEVEYGLNPQRWVSIPLDPGTRMVISDGMRILYDPADLLQNAAAAAATHPRNKVD